MVDLLAEYGSKAPLPILVSELNKLYHEFEAATYENSHPEIFEQLPPIWREMMRVAHEKLPPGPLRVLNLGCGTGFEARQFLAGVDPGRVELLVCYDPSARMLDKCRASLSGRGVPVSFISDLKTIDGRFHALLTNSVLHHMAHPVALIRGIGELLAPNAVWLCGHEPSVRFIRNPACYALLSDYRAADRRRRFLSPSRCARRVWRFLGIRELPEDYAARRAFELGLFSRHPPPDLIGRLVDFHVVHAESSADEGSGLDYKELLAEFEGEWELSWRRTYSFLGPYYPKRVAPWCRRRQHQLAAEYPDDGGNCCLVWVRRQVAF